jgi:hypothetical protein
MAKKSTTTKKEEAPKKSVKKPVVISSKPASISWVSVEGKTGKYLSADGKTAAQIDNRGLVAGLSNKYGGRAIKVSDGVFTIKKG